jgi:hypothetical protein
MNTTMKRILPLSMVGIAVALSLVGHRASSAQDNQDKYTLKVPGGLPFSDFKGYEDWQPVSPSLTDAADVIRLIVANPVMIDAYRQGVPGNGKPFPDGSKIAKVVWKQKKITSPPFSGNTPDTVPGDLAEVELIEKDSKRFPDTHGWGYAVFDYDGSSGKFTPATTTSKSPQGHDAKCGAACHELAASKDYIFTAYPHR